jgi:hypothetical protein
LGWRINISKQAYLISKDNPLLNNLYLYLTLCALLIGGLVVWATNSAPGDFGNYYYGSKFLAGGKFNADVYETNKFNLAVYNEGLRNFFLNYTPVPPITAILYLPFTVFTFTTAKLVWNILNALIWLLMLFRLQRYFKFPAIYTLIFSLVLFIPLKSNFQQGQMYIPVTALLLEGFIAIEKQFNLKAGVLLGIAILLKIFPAIVLGYLVFSRKWKVASLTVVSILTIISVSVIAIDPGIWHNYVFKILPRLSAGEINNTYAISYQSFTVLAKNLLVYDKLHNPNALINSPRLFEILNLGFKLAVLICLLGISRAKLTEAAKFCFWLMGGLLISGYGSIYGLVELAFILLIINELKGKWSVVPIILLLFIAGGLPLAWLGGMPIAFQFIRLYSLIAMFILLLVQFRPVVSPIWVGGFVVLILINWMAYKRQNCAEEYLLEKESHILIYDFKIQGNQLVYDYFDVNGPGKEVITLPYSAESIDTIDMKRVSYLTCTGRTKRRGAPVENNPKAVIIDRKHVIYLSDANRGVGFYTLKTMSFKYVMIN